MKLPASSLHFRPILANNPSGKVYFGSVSIQEKAVRGTRMRQLGWYQLVMILQGAGSYCDSQGRQFPLRRGDLIITTPDVSHQYGPASGTAWSKIVVAFNGPLFDFLHQTGPLQSQAAAIALSPVDAWYRKLYALLRLAPYEREQPMRYFGRFLSVLGEIPFKQDQPASDQRPAWLTRAISLIEAADQTRAIDVNQIALQCKVGYRSFRREFARLMGYGPSEYHKNLRVKTASDLLASGNESIKHIASRLGFYDETYFAKFFKEKTGLSPSQFKAALIKRNIKYVDSERVQKLALQEWFKAEEGKRLLEETTASERRRNWRLLHHEDFTDKDVASRWEFEGNWEVRNGELRVWGKENLFAKLKAPVPGDVRLTFDCHMESAYLSDISFVLGARSPSGETIALSSGYLFQYGGWGNQRITLTGHEGILWDQHATPLSRSRRYHVDAQKIGNRLILKVDDQTIFDVRDPHPTFGAEHATLGLYSYGTEIRYANIQVYTRDSAAQADLLETAGDFMLRGDYHAARSLFSEVIASSHDPLRTEQARNGMSEASRLIALVSEFPAIQARLQTIWPTATIQLGSRGMIVDVRNAGITDLAPLQGLPLHALNCDHNQIADLQPLRGQERLETLSCVNNQIRSLSPLRGMNLLHLHCGNNQIRTLAPLQGMKLRTLSCHNNQIASLAPLLGMELDGLFCGKNRIQDLEPLRGMALTALSFPKNHVTQLDPVRGMLLSRLDCSWNQITDLEPLRGMALSVLHCSGNRITSLDPLQGKSLSLLQCSWNQIRELDPLQGMKLKLLSCHNNPVKSLQPIQESLPTGLYVELDALEAGERKSIEARANEPGFAELLHNAEILFLLKQIPQSIAKLKALAHVAGTHRYLLVPLESTWMEAKKMCEAIGGHLAVIRNQKVNDHLQSRVTEEAAFWIGLYAEGQTPAWINGEPCDFLNIDPKNIGGGVFSITSTGTWKEEIRWVKPHGFCVEWDEPS